MNKRILALGLSLCCTFHCFLSAVDVQGALDELPAVVSSGKQKEHSFRKKSRKEVASNSSRRKVLFFLSAACTALAGIIFYAFLRRSSQGHDAHDVAAQGNVVMHSHQHSEPLSSTIDDYPIKDNFLARMNQTYERYESGDYCKPENDKRKLKAKVLEQMTFLGSSVRTLWRKCGGMTSVYEVHVSPVQEDDLDDEHLSMEITITKGFTYFSKPLCDAPVGYAHEHKVYTKVFPISSNIPSDAKSCIAESTDQYTIEILEELENTAIEKRQIKIDLDKCSTCPICLERSDMISSSGVLTRNFVALQECGHVMHGRCVDTWLRKNSSCPLCRTAIHAKPQVVDKEFRDLASSYFLPLARMAS